MRSNLQSQRRGITGIKISGFKSIKNPVEIQMKSLTVLAGANSSGKSSSMQVMLLLKQTLESPYDPGPIQINGSNVKFSSVDQIFSRMTGSGPSFSIEITMDEGLKVSVKYGFKRNREIYISDFSVNEGGGELVMRKNGRDLSSRWLMPVAKTFVSSFNASDAKPGILRDRCFLIHGIYIYDSNGEVIGNPLVMPLNSIKRAKDIIMEAIHLPGLRGNPERNYPLAVARGSYPGGFENYVASIIWDWKNNNKEQLLGLIKDVSHLKLTNNVDVRKIQDSEIELRVTASDKTGDFVSIADVGLGTSQILPILVALRHAKSGQAVFIEQPEIHLHPRAQALLVDILADAISKGVRIIVETHSSNLLLAIQTAVAKSKILSENVILHWFTKNGEGITEVRSAEIGEDGSLGDWPEDFDDTLINQQKEYLDAVEMHLFSGKN